MDGTNSLIGRVKWFNSKTGYGFITIMNGEKNGNDVFAHHSAIKCSNNQFKYLVQGEYISLNVVNTPDSKHPFQAENITGVCGGKLMCETKYDATMEYNAKKAQENAET